MPIRQIPGMRRRLFATLLFCAAIALLAERVGAQSPAMNAGVIDYPVPRPMAAYAIFDDPTDALYPTTIRTIAAELSGSFSDPNITPAFAVEVAPILLSKDLTLSEYLASRLERVVLRTRISAALSREASGRVGESFGLRWMLHDDADWRADSSLYKLLRAHAALDGAADLSTAIESAASTIAPETLDSARRQFAQSMWDRSVVEMGVAMTQNRSEGSGRTFQVLASGAFPLILEKLQLNVGANARVNSLPTGHTTDLSASAGFFTGSQHWRASATYTILRTSSGDYRSALRAGAALPIGDGFWVAPEVHAILGEPAVVVRIGILYGALGR